MIRVLMTLSYAYYEKIAYMQVREQVLPWDGYSKKPQGFKNVLCKYTVVEEPFFFLF